MEAYILPLPTCEANKSFDLVFEVARHLEIFRLNRCAYIFHTCRILAGALLTCIGHEVSIEPE